jgi:hypothetical protein
VYSSPLLCSGSCVITDPFRSTYTERQNMEHYLIRKNLSEILILAEEYALHLGSCTRWGKPTVPYL